MVNLLFCEAQKVWATQSGHRLLPGSHQAQAFVSAWGSEMPKIFRWEQLLQFRLSVLGPLGSHPLLHVSHLQLGAGGSEEGEEGLIYWIEIVLWEGRGWGLKLCLRRRRPQHRSYWEALVLGLFQKTLCSSLISGCDFSG